MLTILEALWVDLQQCYELGLAVKVAKGIVLAICLSISIWIAVHQEKSIMVAYAFLHYKVCVFYLWAVDPILCISLCLGELPSLQNYIQCLWTAY